MSACTTHSNHDVTFTIPRSYTDYTVPQRAYIGIRTSTIPYTYEGHLKTADFAERMKARGFWELENGCPTFPILNDVYGQQTQTLNKLKSIWSHLSSYNKVSKDMDDPDCTYHCGVEYRI